MLLSVLSGSPSDAQILPVTTESEEARTHFEAGRSAAFHWNVSEAHKHLDAAIAADSSFVLAYLHRAGSSPPSMREGYFNQADRFADQVSEGEKRMIDAFRAFLLEDDIERAIAIFRDLTSQFKDDPYLPGYLCMRYLNAERYDEAIEPCELSLKRDPTFVQAYNFLGHIALGKEDYSSAEETFKRYISLAPEEPQSYRSLGDLYRRMGRYDEAAEQYEKVLDHGPDFYGGWIRPGWMRNILGGTYLEAGRYQEAERVFRKNIQMHSGDPNTYDSLGELYLEMERFDEAAEQFEKSLEIDPDFTSSRDNLIRARIEQKNVRLEESFMRGDVAMIAELFTEKAQLYTGAGHPLEGEESIENFWRRVLNGGNSALEIETTELFVGDEGETATEIGRYQFGPEDETDTGRRVVSIWMHTQDGWKLHRSLWSQ